MATFAKAKPGSGKNFAACVRKVRASKWCKTHNCDPKAVCAAIGRKKYGAKGMAKLSAKGRKK